VRNLARALVTTESMDGDHDEQERRWVPEPEPAMKQAVGCRGRFETFYLYRPEEPSDGWQASFISSRGKIPPPPHLEHVVLSPTDHPPPISSTHLHPTSPATDSSQAAAAVAPKRE
jgi:hypothetical protein